MLKRLFFYPKKHLLIVVPIALIIGLVTGWNVDTSILTKLILPVTILMIYPAMIGFQPKQLINLSYGRLIAVSLALNFLFVPLLAFLLGSTFLSTEPQMFAGLALAALLPTGNMTVAFTMIAEGNVSAAVKLMVISLIVGSFLAPWYLLAMVGRYVPIDVLATMQTIVIIVFIPMVLGVFSYKLILTRYSQEKFNKDIKPVLPAISAWGMLYIIFTSISVNARQISERMELVGVAFLALILFYLVNYIMATFIAGKLFDRKDGYALVYGTVLRNLSISLGMAATFFGPQAALVITLAFIIQQQGAVWFTKLNQKHSFLK